VFHQAEGGFLGVGVGVVGGKTSCGDSFEHVHLIDIRSVLAMSISAPQKHRERPDVFCVGIRLPVSNIRYFQAVQSRCRRYSRKSSSVHVGRYTFQTAWKARRAILKSQVAG